MEEGEVDEREDEEEREGDVDEEGGAAREWLSEKERPR